MAVRRNIGGLSNLISSVRNISRDGYVSAVQTPMGYGEIWNTSNYGDDVFKNNTFVVGVDRLGDSRRRVVANGYEY